MYSRFRSAVVKARAHSSANNSMSGGRTRSTDVPNAPVEPIVSANFTVEQDAKKREFFIRIGTERAILQYNKIGDVMHLEHTEVPEALSGRGIGKILAKFVFDYCVRNSLRMSLHCTYLIYYLNEYAPEYKPHVVRKPERNGAS